VLRPIPRRDLRCVRLRTGASQTWPSPRHDRLGSRVVNLSRLQASRDVAARVLALSGETLDTPLGPRDSHPAPGVCYPALRRLPGRDLHPLETNDPMGALARSHHHDAPWGYLTRATGYGLRFCHHHDRRAGRELHETDGADALIVVDERDGVLSGWQSEFGVGARSDQPSIRVDPDLDW
jgi:hypothetical protein